MYNMCCLVLNLYCYFFLFTIMSNILIIGSYGMLWHMLYDQFVVKFWQDYVIWVDRQTCDITDYWQTSKCIAQYQPDYVINCSAYTAVDKCEDQEKLINFQVNTIGVWNIAKACLMQWCKCVHISTDYVFDWSQEQWYQVWDYPNPINMYGMAKYLGEQSISSILELQQYSIIRTSRLYGWWSQYSNFVNTIIKLAQTKDTLQVVDDQYGAPTYTQTLIDYIMSLISDKRVSGIQHCTDLTPSPGITWYQFAKTIVWYIEISCEVQPCGSQIYPRPAPRPKYSYLINSYAQAWSREQNLKQYINQRYPDLIKHS